GLTYAVVLVGDAGGLAVSHFNPHNGRFSGNCQVRAFARLFEEGCSSAAAPTAVGGRLAIAEAFLFSAIEIVGSWYARLFCRGNDGVVQAVRLGSIRDTQRTVAAMILAGATLIGF